MNQQFKFHFENEFYSLVYLNVSLNIKHHLLICIFTFSGKYLNTKDILYITHIQRVEFF